MNVTDRVSEVAETDIEPTQVRQVKELFGTALAQKQLPVLWMVFWDTKGQLTTRLITIPGLPVEALECVREAVQNEIEVRKGAKA